MSMDAICKACNEDYCPEGVEKPEDCPLWHFKKEMRSGMKIKRKRR